MSGNVYDLSGGGGEGRGNSRGRDSSASDHCGSPSSTFRRFDDDGGASGTNGGLPPLSPIDANRTQNRHQYQRHRQYDLQRHHYQTGSGLGGSEKTSNLLGGGGSYDYPPQQHRYDEGVKSSGGGLTAVGFLAAGSIGRGGGGEAFASGGLGLDDYDYENEGGEKKQQQSYGYSHQHFDRYHHTQQQEGCHAFDDGSSQNDGGPRRLLQLQMEDENDNENNANANSNGNGEFEIDLSPNSCSGSNGNDYGYGNGDGKAAAGEQQTFFYSSGGSRSSSNEDVTSSSLTTNNSSVLSSSTSFRSSFANNTDNGEVRGSTHTKRYNDTIYRTAKKRRYEYDHDEYDHTIDHNVNNHNNSSSMAITPPVDVDEAVPSPSSYPPSDPRFWSYAVGQYASRRSCHERFGHSWPLPERDRAVWTRRDFVFSSKVLGTGNFGEVRLVRCRDRDDDGRGGANTDSSGSNGTVLAIKAISKEEILKSRQGIAIARREIEIQTRLHHPNILGCEGYFHDKSNLYMVLEYANGRDLFALFKKKQMMLADDRRRRLAYGNSGDDDDVDGGDDDDQYVATLPHSLAAQITRQVAQALLYLESKNVAHRDIKPENIMLHYPSGSRDEPMNAQIKLCDLGWSCWCPSPSGNRHFTLCGTPEYIAPEILASSLPTKPRLSTMVGSLSDPMSMGYDARYVDAWSLGVMIFELISNETPFGFPAGRDDKDDNNQQIFAAIQRFDDDDLESLHVGRDVPNEWKLFGRIVRGLLRTNPMERLSMKQVLDHPWLKV